LTVIFAASSWYFHSQLESVNKSGAKLASYGGAMA